MARRHLGPKPRLDQTQRKQLAELLLRTPAQCGFNKYPWTTQLVADLIQREFKVSFYHYPVGLILREMGFTRQMRARRARERDEARITQWRAEVWPALFKKSADAEGVILMADEVGFLMNPSIKKTWAPVAQTPTVPYRKRQHQKVSVLGALVLHAASGKIDLACDFYPYSYVRAEHAATFLHRAQ